MSGRSDRRRGASSLVLAVIAAIVLASCANVVDGHPGGASASGSGGSGGSAHQLTQMWRTALAGEGQEPHRIVGGAADDKRLYVSDDSGKVYALDIATGKQLWSKQVGQRTGTPVTVVGNKVYFYDTDEGWFVLDATTGRLLWHADASPPGIIFRPAVAGGLLLFSEQEVTVVSTATGKALYRKLSFTEKPPTYYSDDEQAGDGTRFFTVADGDNDPYTHQLVALTPRTGKVLWHVRLQTASGGDDAQIYAAPGILYRIHGADGKAQDLRSFDPRTGKQLWQASLPDDLYTSHSLAFVAGRVLVPATGQKFYSVDARTGKVTTVSDDIGGAAEVGDCLGNPCAETSSGVAVFDKNMHETQQIDVPKESLIANLVTGPKGQTFLVGDGIIYRYS